MSRAASFCPTLRGQPHPSLFPQEQLKQCAPARSIALPHILQVGLSPKSRRSEILFGSANGVWTKSTVGAAGCEANTDNC